MVRYARSGADVMVATLTGGERGDILNKAMDRPEVRADLPRIRREEMARAREILGVRQKFLGFVDSGLPEGDPLPPLPDGCFALQKLEDAAEPLVALIREFRPHVILTYDENGGYPHPDHVKTHEITVEAFDAAADPDRYPGSGAPWQPLKLYYFAVPQDQAHRAARGDGAPRAGSPYQWLAEWEDPPKAGPVWNHQGAVRERRHPGPGAAGPRHPDRRRVPGSPCRWRSRQLAPRTTTGPDRWWILSFRR